MSPLVLDRGTGHREVVLSHAVHVSRCVGAVLLPLLLLQPLLLPLPLLLLLLLLPLLPLLLRLLLLEQCCY